MNSFGNTYLRSGWIVLLVLALVTGCKKNDEPAPALPPQSSFVMDFGDFSNPDDTLGSREIGTYQNWGFAYTNVVVWNTFLTVGLAVPVASFIESFNHEAIYHPNQDNWTWSYNVTVGLVVYEAELTGYLESDSVVWEMRITKGNEYAGFLWYHGKSAMDQSGGYWILNDNPLNPNTLLQIDWNNYADGTADIRYTNIVPGGNENGSNIFYATLTGEMNRTYEIYIASTDNTTDIEWSSVYHNGHVSDPHHYGDNNWHCWDLNLMDVECP